MALIECPECAGKVSSYAQSCPHCGFPMIITQAPMVGSPLTDKIASLQEGEIFELGEWGSPNTKTAIKWIVLKRTKNLRLIISKDCVDFLQYHFEQGEICWENSSLHKWLNGEFYEVAFNDDEKSIIPNIMTVKQNIDIWYDFEDHWALDKVFLLTPSEFEHHMQTEAL